MSCVADSASANCAGPDEPCYLDMRCGTADDPHGGLGCNAGGWEWCRFCGFGQFESIACPGEALGSGQTSALTQNISTGGMVTVVAVVATLIICCCLVACLVVRRRRRREAQQKEQAKADDAVLTSGEEELPAFAAHTPFRKERKEKGEVQAEERRSTLMEVPFVQDWASVELRAMLSKGSIGRVYRVAKVDEPTKAFALRRFNIDTIALFTERRLVNWIGTLTELEHPNLLKVHGLLTDGKFDFGMMMDVAHTTLEKMLLHAATDPDIADGARALWRRLASDISSGLAHLHERKITHLALHPRNVLLDTSMHAKLGDYGRSARLISMRASDETSMLDSQPGKLKEDARLYSAPELLRGEHFDSRCDVWSLGCILARVVTQRPLHSVFGHDLSAMSVEEAQATVSRMLLRVTTGEVNPVQEVLKGGDSRGRSIRPQFAAPLIETCVSLDRQARPSAAMVVTVFSDRERTTIQGWKREARESRRASIAAAATGQYSSVGSSTNVPNPPGMALPSASALPAPSKMPAPAPGTALPSAAALPAPSNALPAPSKMPAPKHWQAAGTSKAAEVQIGDASTATRAAVAESATRRATVLEAVDDVPETERARAPKRAEPVMQSLSRSSVADALGLEPVDPSSPRSRAPAVDGVGEALRRGSVAAEFGLDEPEGADGADVEDLSLQAGERVYMPLSRPAAPMGADAGGEGARAEPPTTPRASAAARSGAKDARKRAQKAKLVEDVLETMLASQKGGDVASSVASLTKLMEAPAPGVDADAPDADADALDEPDAAVEDGASLEHLSEKLAGSEASSSTDERVTRRTVLERRTTVGHGERKTSIERRTTIGRNTERNTERRTTTDRRTTQRRPTDDEAEAVVTEKQMRATRVRI
jgi:serine/threonine protein kinase